MNNPRNLLIIRTDRIGDLVLTIPLARIIKKHYPNCKITFLINDYTKDLLFKHPFIDDIITIKTKNKKQSLFSNYKIIKKLNFDTTLIVSPNIKIALLVFLTGIKNRIGTGFRWYSFFFNKKIFAHRKYAEKNELEFNVDFLQKLNIKEDINKDNIKYDLQLNEQSKINTDKILQENNVDKSKTLVIVHPGSGESADRLPLQKYKELLKYINTTYNIEVLITGNKNEKNLCNELSRNSKAKNLSGKLNLSELIIVIDKCDLFISNSTGPLHIASALNKKVIGFYPNLLSCSFKRWGPYSANAYIFTPKTNCENCKKEQCKDKSCMNYIDLENVYKKIKLFGFNLLTNGKVNDK